LGTPNPAAPAHSDLRVARGLQEAEAVAEALGGQAELELLLEHGGAALQDHLVVLWGPRDKGSLVGPGPDTTSTAGRRPLPPPFPLWKR
jgi:hypothetical protein